VSTKMVKIFSIKLIKRIPGSRKIQQIKNFFFVALLHVLLHPYTKFQVNPMNCYGSSRIHKMVKIFSMKFTKWIPGSRKIQQITIFFFVALLHVILHPYTKFQVYPMNGYGSSRVHKMFKIFRIKFTKWIPESRRIQEIENFFFVAHLHVSLHPYTKFQANQINRYGSSTVHKKLLIFSGSYLQSGSQDLGKSSKSKMSSSLHMFMLFGIHTPNFKRIL